MTSNPHYIADTKFIKKPDQNSPDFIFDPRALNIVWGRDGRYWSMPQNDEGGPGMGAAAELLQVSWLEVTGSVVELQPRKSYRVGFNVELKPDAFGWNGCPVYLMAKVGKKGRYKWKKINLQDQGEKPPYFITDQFKIDESSTDKTLYFGLYEVWSGKWKGGLKLNHAIIKEE